ncbi:palindromic element RPE4 domain-containing protein [Rickettsia sp. R2]|uniref:Palindromic element RPE4 domain-containing protein n=1 Tax=Rickettsia japonica TaxID=35790 RepID=A0ABM6YIJ6_RICJA|nr:palindromic element RPE4 domain-containing protein [Rickettsia japonica]QHE25434.1 palindromic element RPE4 domain-containing protein [Rickettsia japonica]
MSSRGLTTGSSNKY